MDGATKIIVLSHRNYHWFPQEKKSSFEYLSYSNTLSSKLAVVNYLVI